MALTLVLPSSNFEESYVEYIQELADEERYPFPLDFDYSDFAALINRLDNFAKGVNIPKGFVPSSTFWLIDKENLLGVSSLRHYLNERIKKIGGHIGLGIRPSYRGKGLGNLLMALTIKEAQKLKIEELHIHCYKNNKASVRMIISNGGVLDSEVEEEESREVVQRYLINNA